MFTLDRAKQAENKSKKIVDVFTKTVNDLQEVNTAIDGHIDTHTEKKRKIEEKLTSLAQTKANNAKVIDKINKIFE